MSLVTLTSTTYNTNLSQKLPFEENHVRKVLSESGRELMNQIMSAQDDEHHYSGRKKEEDGEIGVFGAERYFNGGIDHVHVHSPSPRLARNIIEAKKLEFVKDEAIKPVIHQGTPSVRSESSWNSQKALLQSVLRNSPRPKPHNKAGNGKSFFSGLDFCRCYCSDRNSLDIEEVQVGEISFKRPPNGKPAISKGSVDVKKPAAATEPWIKEDIFTFPTTSPSVGSIRPVKIPLQGGDVDEIGRKSLEVFGSPVIGGRRNKSLNLERKLKMLSWDKSNKTPKATTEEITDHNSDSDASSDLFEIESLTGGKSNNNNNPFLARQASDAAASGCVTPTTCYAPSEASIEWSVVTASAADHFSVMSDYDERRPSTTTIPSPIKTFSMTTSKNNSNKEIHQRRRSGGLLGCTSQKAVEVAGDHEYKMNENKASFDPRMRRVSDSYIPATRFRPEIKLADFEQAQTPRILAHSPQSSHILYIQ
ncbi:hypothetical protein CCACVL1_13934 [Corchorus capsularis]|uniref:Uncharacterized protein n=1 Tax=Corchorus capsularis TaxID=210143 RepID=A0A1R3I8W5_COCAP|nr:hypothetical protein CCACVL1_13934 [Corchorus capsularis]